MLVKYIMWSFMSSKQTLILSHLIATHCIFFFFFLEEPVSCKYICTWSLRAETCWCYVMKSSHNNSSSSSSSQPPLLGEYLETQDKRHGRECGAQSIGTHSMWAEQTIRASHLSLSCSEICSSTTHKVQTQSKPDPECISAHTVFWKKQKTLQSTK